MSNGLATWIVVRRPHPDVDLGTVERVRLTKRHAVLDAGSLGVAGYRYNTAPDPWDDDPRWVGNIVPEVGMTVHAEPLRAWPYSHEGEQAELRMALRRFDAVFGSEEP